MLVFFVLLCFAVEGLSYEENPSFAKPKPHRLCPVNEVHVKCRTICPPQFCNISYTDFVCGPETKKCEPGCDCIKDYLRDDDGNCVLNDKCPPPKPQCGENQVPSDCADDYSSVPTITLCRPGCRCIESHVRNTLNECVPRSPDIDCPKNEVSSTCKQTCPPQDCSWDRTKMACKPGPCQPGCNCIEGHLRDEAGNCIPKENCPPILPQCGKFEEPTDCAKNIGPYDSTLTIKCSPCQCIQGYVRDSNGVCVSQDELCKSDRNTTYMLCPNRCKSTCKNPNRICSQECRESYGCGCKAGYLTSDDGKCILPQDCPAPIKCTGINEIYNQCPPACFSEGCGDKQPKICNTFAIHECQPQCVCKKNYRRNSFGICIHISQCPPQCGKYEEPTDCSYDIVQPTDVVSESKIRCLPGCKCIAGHQRDSNGACVKTIQCGKNEEVSDCKKECPPDSCAWDPVLMDCKPVPCQRGCNCIKGYLRNDKGKCIPQQKCPKYQCGKHEKWTDCSDNYYPQLHYAEDTSVRCFPGCSCIAGYQRDSRGVCVRIPRCGRNETYVPCNAGCPTQYCPKDDSLAIVACSQPFPCRGGCACKRNYKYRSYEDKRCILASECPPVKCTRKHEEWVSCPLPCFTDACGELDKETAACNSFAEPECQPRCMCRTNYCRDSSGNCIPKEKCPKQPIST